MSQEVDDHLGEARVEGRGPVHNGEAQGGHCHGAHGGGLVAQTLAQGGKDGGRRRGEKLAEAFAYDGAHALLGRALGLGEEQGQDGRHVGRQGLVLGREDELLERLEEQVVLRRVPGVPHARDNLGQVRAHVPGRNGAESKGPGGAHLLRRRVEGRGQRGQECGLVVREVRLAANLAEAVEGKELGRLVCGAHTTHELLHGASRLVVRGPLAQGGNAEGHALERVLARGRGAVRLLRDGKDLLEDGLEGEAGRLACRDRSEEVFHPGNGGALEQRRGEEDDEGAHGVLRHEGPRHRRVRLHELEAQRERLRGELQVAVGDDGRELDENRLHLLGPERGRVVARDFAEGKEGGEAQAARCLPKVGAELGEQGGDGVRQGEVKGARGDGLKGAHGGEASDLIAQAVEENGQSGGELVAQRVPEGGHEDTHGGDGGLLHLLVLVQGCEAHGHGVVERGHKVTQGQGRCRGRLWAERVA
mmetsp:Transcript_23685/g.64271  ORF Transcript_23685/g.64271 Transcript_23685/m.64271 type:complete len:475 (-) Transcript_23685:624-2048(-)